MHLCIQQIYRDPSLVGLSFWPSTWSREKPCSCLLGVGWGLASGGDHFRSHPFLCLMRKSLSGCLLCFTLPVPEHLQAFWGLAFIAAYREEPFLPANERRERGKEGGRQHTWERACSEVGLICHFTKQMT